VSVSAELQELVFGTLMSNGPVTAIVGKNVFDDVPTADPYPRITFGPSDSVSDDADCVDGEEITLQVDCWVRQSGKLHPCRQLVDAVKAALHEQNLALPDPYVLNTIRVQQTRVIRDPDGETAHGVVVVTALVET